MADVVISRSLVLANLLKLRVKILIMIERSKISDSNSIDDALLLFFLRFLIIFLKCQETSRRIVYLQIEFKRRTSIRF